MTNHFTPEQISQILEEFFKVVGTRQYIGARYVPIFGRKGEESIEWDNSAPYEPLTIVLYQGNSYTSRQYVPVGVEITNQEFWAITGNYNAQVEQYRRDVQAFDGRITANANAIETETANRTAAVTAEKTRAEDAERALQTNIDAEKNRAEGAEQVNATAIDAEKTRAEGAEQVNATAIAAEKTRAEGAEQELQTNIDTLKTSRKLALFFGDSWTATANHQPVPDENNSWVKHVADSLGCDNKIFATAGALLSGNESGRDFNSQIDSAFAAVPNTYDVEWIIVLGGVNDFNSVNTVTPQSFQDAVYTRLLRLKNHFTKAKIVFVPMNMFFYRVGSTNNPGTPNVTIPADRYVTFVYMCENLIRRVGCNIIYLRDFASYFRFNGQEVYRPNDDSSFTASGGTIHPNVLGNRLIADFIINGIYGNEFKYPVLMSSVNSAVTINENHSQFNGHAINWNFKFTSSNADMPANTFVPLLKIMSGQYPRVVSDTIGDSNGYHYLGFAHCINDPSLNVTLYVRDITKTDDGTQVYLFTPATFTGNKAFCVNAVTEIMGA